MSYKLKPNVAGFTVVDGPFAGREFRGGRIYKDIPLREKEKFIEITTEGAQPANHKDSTPAKKKPEVTNG